MRRVLQGFTTIDRLKACGRVPVNQHNGGAVIRGTTTSEGLQTGIAGLMRCGSPWACPVCARRIAVERAKDVARVLQAVADTGGSAALLTLTIRHRKHHRLVDLWDALSSAWGRVTSGRGWTEDRELFGIRGTIRTVEYTHSPDTGHHLHLHAVVVFTEQHSPEYMTEMGYRAFGRWARALERKGFDAVAEKGGLDVRPIRLDGDSIESMAEYVSKAAFEVASSVTKKGRSGNRSAFQILADACQGEADSIELWAEWERASLGRKQVTYSRGLREWARVGREKSGAEIVSKDMQGEDLLVLPAETWKAIRDADIVGLLDCIELGGVGAGIRWLRSRGLAFSVPEPRPPADDG